MDAVIAQVAKDLAESKYAIALTGAGISTESGIPDFRSPGGLWSKFDPDDFTIDKFLNSAQTRKKMWKLLLDGGLMADAAPNVAHLAIAELEKMGKLSCVITQNVDNLHQKAGNDPARVHELHGNMQWLICLNCGQKYPLENLTKNISSAESIPDCKKCGGILKPDVIFFGEALPQDVLSLAVHESQESDLFIVIGSSLVVYPAANMPLYAKKAGAGIIIINLGETQQDEIADVIIDHSTGKTMTDIMSKLKELSR